MSQVDLEMAARLFDCNKHLLHGWNFEQFARDPMYALITAQITTKKRFESEFITPDYEREEWLFDFRKVLCDAGMSQMKAQVEQDYEFGREGVNADLNICPLCYGRRWLLKRGMIPAPSKGQGVNHE